MICRICGKNFRHLGSHLWHKHKILARAYKEEFGLPYSYALIDRDIKEKKQKRFWERSEKYLLNLKKAGKKYQFKRGWSCGRHRTSNSEKKAIIDRIKKVNRANKNLKPCPVCRMKFHHLESHLYNKHRLLKC